MLAENPRPAVSTHRISLPPVRRTSPAWWTAAALIGCCWLLIFNQQRLEWSVNPTYSYGWAVPLLAGYLLWERWKCRPPVTSPGPRWPWLLAPALLLLAYLPIRVIQEANPDWVKINVSMAVVAFGVTLAAAGAIGGWRYVAHFAFPLAFCFTALPWPVWLEEFFTQNLMRANASACAELLTLLGQPAMAQGNLVQVGSAWVDVQEACSGIRSLQTAFMMSLFFGEFYRLGWWARGGLLLGSFAVAFALNLARTMTLAHLTGVGGDALAEKWHDPIGLGVMVLCLVALWSLAEYFQRRRGAPPRRPVATTRPRAPFPIWFAAAGVLWLAGSEVATAGWYDYHERRMPAPVEWDVAWPEHAADFHRTEFSERARALLKYNEASSVAWRADDRHWQAYYLRWYPGRVSKFLSGSHYPAVCLPATGLKLVTETGTFTCRVGALTIPFRTYLFDRNGEDVYVYHAIMEDVPSPDGLIAYRQANSTERLRSVWRGERNLGQRVLGVALSGPASAAEANAAVAQMLRRLIQTPGPAVAAQ